LQLGKRFC